MSTKEYEVLTYQEVIVVEADSYIIENDLLVFKRQGDVTGVFNQWLRFVETVTEDTQ